MYESVEIIIPNGSNHADYTYDNLSYVNCGTASCTSITRTILCGISTGNLNTEFDTATITVC
jgi:hypothetical protein